MNVNLSKYEFFELGFAQLALNLGLLSTSVFMRFVYYKEVKFQMEKNGHNKSTAVQIAADITKASLSTVWRSVRYFEE
jgi:hypothetical protein